MMSLEKPKRSPGARRAVASAAFALIAALTLLGCSSDPGTTNVPIDSYSAEAPDRQIHLDFTVGVQQNNKDELRVTETDTTVAIEVVVPVQTGEFLTMEAYMMERTVELDAPLGERSVIDASTGMEAPKDAK